VVLPLFNEEALVPGLSSVLARVRAALEGHDATFLAVDDGSSDGTAAALRMLEGLEVVTHERNRGVGAAMATGLQRAAGDVAIVYDPDEAYAPEALTALVDALAGADIATLSPYHPDGGIEGVGRLRLFLSRGASWLYRRRLKSPLHTFTCAVRAYRLDRVRPLLGNIPADFTAAAWLLAAGLRAGLRIVEVPAVLRARGTGQSKMRIARTIRAHLRLLRDLAVTPTKSKEGL